MDELDRDALVRDLGVELDRALDRQRSRTWVRIIALIIGVVGIVLLVGMLWDGESTYQSRDDSYDRDTLMVEPEVIVVEVDGRDVTCISRTGLFEASLSCDWESAGDPEPEADEGE
ncbi:hypothetical protein IDM40_26915 [Nocardiopsis sp. HNM0947]|uniref:Uncharacterized protein n=1 Tax=Nocardiopsis coralli TaxID=2772213 RepID=A0ABR9PEP6_9ACTN|nr:hypothetical protein [Nocardiopsis coralli]MBE3002304.1 hypothetical protein [Nocardiopsis coralli]